VVKVSAKSSVLNNGGNFNIILSFLSGLICGGKAPGSGIAININGERVIGASCCYKANLDSQDNRRFGEHPQMTTIIL
jgi:hypothetical protein